MSTDNTTLKPSAATLPDQEICREALIEKYAKGEETSIEQVRRRVARALAVVEAEGDRAKWERRFAKTLEDGFIPAGRINSAAGIALQATLINCFVQPVGDSISEVVDGKPGIYTALSEAAETMRRGGGVGYDFSSIRPKGAEVKGTHSRASGSSGPTRSIGAGRIVVPTTVYSEAPFHARNSVTGVTPVMSAARPGIRRQRSSRVLVASSSWESWLQTTSGSKREV